MATLVIGLRGEAHAQVTVETTAAQVGSGLVPVFSTPSLVALVEKAAVVALAPYCGPDETTVGTRIDLAHLAATPVGAAVRAAAELVAIDGRKLTFVVQAFDEHEQIGEGRHERVVVSTARFMARVAAKRSSRP